MSSNPASFRFVHNISEDAAHDTVRKALRDHDNALTDIYSAIPVLKAQIEAKNVTTTTTTQISGPAPNTPTIVPGNMPAIAHEWLNSYDSTTGAFTATQPAFTDISGIATSAQLPFPTATTIGGVESAAPVAHEWVDSISTAGVPHLSQPSFADFSGNLTTSQLPLAGLSVTITTAKLTVGGANGSQTFTNGILTAQVQAT